MTQTNLKKNGKSNKTTLSKVLGKSGNKKLSKAPASKPVKKPTAPKMPGEWLYLNKEELSLRKIYELFNEAQNAEYWEAAGVLGNFITRERYTGYGRFRGHAWR